jgi:hypothetical protein
LYIRYSINNLLVAAQGMASLLSLMLTLRDLNKLKEDENKSETNLLSHYGMDSFNDKKLKIFL